jgi:uncharacterized integral membrane protein (TIGR02327 family)
MFEVALSLTVFVLSLWALDALNFSKLLKINKVTQAQLLYLLLAMSMSTLVLQFLLGLRITN